MTNYCKSLTSYARRETLCAQVGGHKIGGGNPVVVQTMTNTLPATAPEKFLDRFLLLPFFLIKKFFSFF